MVGAEGKDVAHIGLTLVRRSLSPRLSQWPPKTKDGGPGVARDGGERRMGAVTPGETLGTLYNIHVGSNKTKQHNLKPGFQNAMIGGSPKALLSSGPFRARPMWVLGSFT